MWNAAVDGRVLHFELAGINNQNFLMRDVETGSWWQQVTGRAIQGPLRGERLELVPWDEVSFAIWKAENPGGLVLEPDERFRDQYAAVDWDESMDDVPVVTPYGEDDPLEPRDLVLGLTIGGQARAYPWPVLREQSPIVDLLGGRAIAVVLADDGRSARVFDRTLDGQTLELYRKPDAEELLLVDAQTGSEWAFSGTAVAGPLAGRRLERIQALKDYWFDWVLYRPGTSIYTGEGLTSGTGADISG